MKYWQIPLVVVVVVGLGVVTLFWLKIRIDPRGIYRETSELKLEKYDFDNLRKRGGIASEIIVGDSIEAVEVRRKNLGQKYQFETQEFYFVSNGKKISGMLNKVEGSEKTIIMVRGYAEKAGYYPGSGTWRVADKLAEARYNTVSLDFLGYGNSDQESTDVLEARFEKVESLLDLIASVEKKFDGKIGIWAHSNGGQIVLSALEITGENYPTVLWAPMTDPFPQSVLATIDEGSPVKREIENFLKKYDSRRYAFENYYEWITAPILIQQGTRDEWCRVEWQQKVIEGINRTGKKASLEIFEGDDHNLRINWAKAVDQDSSFYRNFLVK